MTPAQLGALFGALLLGGIIGVAGNRLASDAGPMRATETVVRGEGTLENVPDAPLLVRAESLRLPEGFESTQFHGGPTFTIVTAGEIEVVDGGRASTYGPGEFFFEPEGRPHTVRALETSLLSVVRLLPFGAPDTTEVR